MKKITMLSHVLTITIALSITATAFVGCGDAGGTVDVSSVPPSSETSSVLSSEASSAISSEVPSDVPSSEASSATPSTSSAPASSSKTTASNANWEDVPVSTNWTAHMDSNLFTIGIKKIPIIYTTGNGKLDIGDSSTFSLYRMNDKHEWETLVSMSPKTVATIAPPGKTGTIKYNAGDKLNELGTYKLSCHIGGKSMEFEFFVEEDMSWTEGPISTNWKAYLDAELYAVGTKELIFTVETGNGILESSGGNAFSLYRLGDDEKWEQLIQIVPQTVAVISPPGKTFTYKCNVGDKLDRAGTYKYSRYVTGEEKVEITFEVQ